jgi:hypothetical protein
MLRLFDQQPDLRLQVEYMYLGQDMDHDYDRRKFIALFLNLKVLDIQRSVEYKERHFSSHKPFYPAVMGNQME